MSRHEFKVAIAALIDVLVRDALADGQSTDVIFRGLAAESLELAARIHANVGGDKQTFLGMAEQLLDVVRLSNQGRTM